MSKNRTVELANVVVNFGDKGLVENLKDFVLPGIQDKNIRGRGEEIFENVVDGGSGRGSLVM